MWLSLMVDNRITLERFIDAECKCNSQIMDFSLNLHLDRGQTVWLQIDTTGKLEYQNHLFSGELISVDHY